MTCRSDAVHRSPPSRWSCCCCWWAWRLVVARPAHPDEERPCPARSRRPATGRRDHLRAGRGGAGERGRHRQGGRPAGEARREASLKLVSRPGVRRGGRREGPCPPEAGRRHQGRGGRGEGAGDAGEGGLNLAKTQLGYATLKAPHDGVVVTVTTKRVGRRPPRRALVTLSDPADVWVRRSSPSHCSGRSGWGRRCASPRTAPPTSTARSPGSRPNPTTSTPWRPGTSVRLAHAFRVQLPASASGFLPGQPVDVTRHDPAQPNASHEPPVEAWPDPQVRRPDRGGRRRSPYRAAPSSGCSARRRGQDNPAADARHRASPRRRGRPRVRRPSPASPRRSPPHRLHEPAVLHVPRPDRQREHRLLRHATGRPPA